MAWHLICKGRNNIPFIYMFITDEKETERRKERENLSTFSWIKLKQLEISWIKFTGSPVLDAAAVFMILNLCAHYFLIFFFHLFICAWSHRIFSCVTRREAKMPGPFLKSVKSNCQRLAEQKETREQGIRWGAGKQGCKSKHLHSKVQQAELHSKIYTWSELCSARLKIHSVNAV